MLMFVPFPVNRGGRTPGSNSTMVTSRLARRTVTSRRSDEVTRRYCECNRGGPFAGTMFSFAPGFDALAALGAVSSKRGRSAALDKPHTAGAVVCRGRKWSGYHCSRKGVAPAAWYAPTER